MFPFRDGRLDSSRGRVFCTRQLINNIIRLTDALVADQFEERNYKTLSKDFEGHRESYSSERFVEIIFTVRFCAGRGGAPTKKGNVDDLNWFRNEQQFLVRFSTISLLSADTFLFHLFLIISDVSRGANGKLVFCRETFSL